MTLRLPNILRDSKSSAHSKSSMESYSLKQKVYRFLTVRTATPAQLTMPSSYDTPSRNRTPSDEGDIESLSVSLSTSPRKLIKVGLESNFLILLLNLTHVNVINRLSDSFKLRSAQQRHTAELSVANSKMSRMAYQIAPSPSPNDPRSLMHTTHLVKKLMISMMSNTLLSRLGTSFV